MKKQGYIKNFIYFFTHKTLTREQQAKVQNLLARDCMNEEYNQKYVVDSSTNETTTKPIKYVPPKNLNSFLFQYNQEDILKYTCHEIDTDGVVNDINEACKTEAYCFKKHVQLIQEHLTGLLDKFKRNKIFLDSKFIAMLMAYVGLTSEKWSSLNVGTSWNSNDIVAWSREHSAVIPSPGKNIARQQRDNGFKMKEPYISNINGQRILSFKDLVIYFKSLFHIRRDNSLRKIITYQNEHIEIDGLDIEFASEAFDDRIELLTNVDKLVQAYKEIIKICRNANKSGPLKIELSFYEEGDSVFFTIHDINHPYGKTLKSAIERIGQEQTNLIKNQINGLCDLYIEADFGNDEYARIGLWTNQSSILGEKPNIIVDKLDKAEGVKYILKFSYI